MLTDMREDIFGQLAVECEFVRKEQIKKNLLNPARPYAMRRAFASAFSVESERM